MTKVKCDGKTHRLMSIYERPEANDGWTVVRWCKDCGSVVIDYEQDGKIAPGYYMPMQFPTMTYPNQNREKADAQR